MMIPGLAATTRKRPLAPLSRVRLASSSNTRLRHRAIDRMMFVRGHGSRMAGRPQDAEQAVARNRSKAFLSHLVVARHR